MSGRSQPHQFPAPSLLDKLFDNAPETPDARPDPHFGLSEFRAALARDLEALLNTRAPAPETFARYPLAATSMLAYGIPDPSSMSLLNPDDRETLRRQVCRAIEQFEPRLGNVRVALDVLDDGERLLRFRVHAVLRTHPQRPAVSFDATLRPSSSAFLVSR